MSYHPFKEIEFVEEMFLITSSITIWFKFFVFALFGVEFDFEILLPQLKLVMFALDITSLIILLFFVCVLTVLGVDSIEFFDDFPLRLILRQLSVFDF